MYLISTLNSQIDGFKIIASGTKKELITMFEGSQLKQEFFY